MSKKKTNKKILKFKPGIEINISFIIVSIIMLYVIYNIFSYFTRKHVSVYEVKMGSIARNNHYEAMAIRDETVVNADRDGYLFYYTSNGSRVGVKTPVYGIDANGSLTKKLNNAKVKQTELSKAELASFEKSITGFLDGYKPAQFNNTYIFKNDLVEQIQKSYSRDTTSAYENDINPAVQNGSYSIVNAPSDGYLIYSIDGYEGTNLENYYQKKKSNSQDAIPDLRTSDKIKANTPIYKMVNSDDWNLVMQISKKVAKELENTKSIKIKFDYDSSKTNASVKIEEHQGDYYLILGLTNSMERFANQRYIPIELMINTESGLKVPNSAITTHDFYVIPKDYFMQGNNSTSFGIMVRGKDSLDEFRPLDIYYADKDNYYIIKEDITDADYLVIPNSTDTYRIDKKMVTKKGVYNVNKGYADFRVINVEYSTDDYSIITEDGSFGITLYDHIALDGNSIINGKIIY